MKDIYRSLTENDGESGILKSLLEENELEALKTNPFHITGNDIRVRKLFNDLHQPHHAHLHMDHH